MIAEIPAGVFQIPDNALWILSGWVLSCLISGWSCYRWGLRSQKAAEKLKAMVSVLAIIDGALAEFVKRKDLLDVFKRTLGHLTRATFAFSCQLGRRSRAGIEKALTNYQAQQVTGLPIFMTTSTQLDMAKIETERKEITAALNKLRDAITDV